MRKRKSRRRSPRFRLNLRFFMLVGIFSFVTIALLMLRKELNHSVWNGKEPLIFVSDTKPIIIFSYLPLEKTINGILLPGNTMVKAAYGYGEYQAKSLLQLGKLENRGPMILVESLQEFLGLPIDSWLPFNKVLTWQGSKQDQTVNFKKGLSSQGLNFTFNLEDEISLSRWDWLRFWWGVRKIRLDKINLINLSESVNLMESRLPDDSLVLRAESGDLDVLVKQYFKDQNLVNEGLAIGVYNGTQVAGLAKQAARLIENIGGQVVEVRDWNEEYEECQIRAREELTKSTTVLKLSQAFGCQNGGHSLEGSLSEVAVILGKSYAKKLGEE